MTDWSALLTDIPARPLHGSLHRLIENQSPLATTQVTASLARQSVLDTMLDQPAPTLLPGTERLHPWLAAPFRAPPLEYGSRFGRRTDPGLLYGAHATPTALAEVAYYRFVLRAGMAAPPARKIDTQHTMLEIAYHTAAGCQLQAPPFEAHAADLRNPTDYRETQALGNLMRAAGIEAFEYVSARDPDCGLNVALLSPASIANPQPTTQALWLCELTATRVQFRAAIEGTLVGFTRATFEIEGRLPFPAG